MNELIQSDVVYTTNRGTPVTDSLKVAHAFGRLHKNVIKAIRCVMMSANLLADRQTFCETTYYDAQGKKQPLFLMTKEGFCALVMRWNGEKANQFKLAFIEMFANKCRPRQSRKRSHKRCALRRNRRKQSKRNKSNLKNKPQRLHLQPQ